LLHVREMTANQAVALMAPLEEDYRHNNRPTQRTELQEGLESGVGDGGRCRLRAEVEGPAGFGPGRRRQGWRPA
jgi:hypothetical protein